MFRATILILPNFFKNESSQVNHKRQGDELFYYIAVKRALGQQVACLESLSLGWDVLKHAFNVSWYIPKENERLKNLKGSSRMHCILLFSLL